MEGSITESSDRIQSCLRIAENGWRLSPTGICSLLLGEISRGVLRARTSSLRAAHLSCRTGGGGTLLSPAAPNGHLYLNLVLGDGAGTQAMYMCTKAELTQDKATE